MVATERRQKQISFHNVDLYNSIQIPVREYLLELTHDLELSVLLNQMIFSKKEYMTLNDIKKLSLNEKTKQTLRVKLEQLIELGLIKKIQENKMLYNQDLYKVSKEVIAPEENNKILGIIEGKDLHYEFHYLMAMIINKFRTYALSGVSEMIISVAQLKIMLGVNNSDSSIRQVLKQLEVDEYIKTEIIRNTKKYIFNTDKLINNYSLEDINKYTNELVYYYEEYLNRIIMINKLKLEEINPILINFKNIIKKMFEAGKVDYYILKHILIYLIHNHKIDVYISPDVLREDYNKLSILSKELSKRKAKRFIYKLKNNLLDTDTKKEISVKDVKDDKQTSDLDLWYEAISFVGSIKEALKKWFYTSLAGVTDIDFDDYCQEAIKSAYEHLKKNQDKDTNKYMLSTIKYRLKAFMYQKRIVRDDGENKTSIVNYEYEFDNLNLSTNNTDNDKEINITNLNNIINILDERSIFIITNYLGFNGISLTFKEIGIKLNISESLVARKYKKAILLLRKKYPPDKEQEVRDLIYNTYTNNL